MTNKSADRLYHIDSLISTESLTASMLMSLRIEIPLFNEDSAQSIYTIQKTKKPTNH